MEAIEEKLLPKSIEHEELVLGSVMLEPDRVYDAINILQPEHFYKEAHQRIFAAIYQLVDEAVPTDIITVTDQLRKNGHLEEIGGPVFVTKLIQDLGTASKLEYAAYIVYETHLKRHLIQNGSRFVNDLYDISKDFEELKNNHIKELMDLDTFTINQAVHVRDEVDKTVDRIFAKAAGQELEDDFVVPTKISHIDSHFGGGIPMGLNILAARPGMGKTSFIAQMANNMAVHQGIPVGIWELEMETKQLVMWLISQNTHIPAEKIRDGKLTDEELNRVETAASEIANAPLYINASAKLNTMQLRSQVYMLKQRYNIQIAFVDYLQLLTPVMTGSNRTRNDEVGEMSRELKIIQKETGIPLVALSQLNREIERRNGDKKPKLSDLRESGSIEQDADVVMFLHRPEKYGIEEFQDGRSTENITQALVEKFRHGDTGSLLLHFEPEILHFTQAASSWENAEYSKMAEDNKSKAIPDNFDFDNEEEPF